MSLQSLKNLASIDARYHAMITDNADEVKILYRHGVKFTFLDFITALGDAKTKVALAIWKLNLQGSVSKEDWDVNDRVEDPVPLESTIDLFASVCDPPLVNFWFQEYGKEQFLEIINEQSKTNIFGLSTDKDVIISYMLEHFPMLPKLIMFHNCKGLVELVKALRSTASEHVFDLDNLLSVMFISYGWLGAIIRFKTIEVRQRARPYLDYYFQLAMKCENILIMEWLRKTFPHVDQQLQRGRFNVNITRRSPNIQEYLTSLTLQNERMAKYTAIEYDDVETLRSLEVNFDINDFIMALANRNVKVADYLMKLFVQRAPREIAPIFQPKYMSPITSQQILDLLGDICTDDMFQLWYENYASTNLEGLLTDLSELRDYTILETTIYLDYNWPLIVKIVEYRNEACIQALSHLWSSYQGANLLLIDVLGAYGWVDIINDIQQEYIPIYDDNAMIEPLVYDALNIKNFLLVEWVRRNFENAREFIQEIEEYYGVDMLPETLKYLQFFSRT